MRESTISKEELERYRINHLRIWRRMVQMIEAGKMLVVREDSPRDAEDLYREYKRRIHAE